MFLRMLMQLRTLTQLRNPTWALAALLGCNDVSGESDDVDVETSFQGETSETGETSFVDTDTSGTSGTGIGDDTETGDAEGCGHAPEGMVCVPAGPFLQGSADGEADEQPERVVTLSVFWIDRLEVTVSQYDACVDAGVCAAPMLANDHCLLPRFRLGEDELADHPVNCVTWLSAGDYCAWVGKRRPTEAEWEKAARGEDGRTYPWGEEPPTCERAVMQEIEGEQGCGASAPAPVGSRPLGASPYGALDMAGNVGEWVEDYYDWSYYEEAPDEDPMGPETSSFPTEQRVERGSSFIHSADQLRSARRSRGSATLEAAFVGFRCARSAE